MLYGDWIGRWGRSFPTKEALYDTIKNRRYTYGELADAVHRMANFLQEELGIAKGDRVAVLSLNRTEYLVLFFATSRLGAILAPLNFRLAADEYIYLMEDANPLALFFDETHRPIVEGLQKKVAVTHWICFDSNARFGISLADVWGALPIHPPPPVSIDEDDPQLIIYTSGTTGLPKGVILTHKMVTWNSFNTNIGWDLRSKDRTVLHSALFYTAGWNIFTLPLFHCRGTNIIINGFDADIILDLIEKERLTIFFGVPTMFQMLMDSKKFTATDMSSIRFMVSGGAPLPKKIADVFQEQKGIHLWEGYGLTEVGPNNFLANGKLGSVGHPMFHVDIKVIDASGNEVGVGEEGELLIRGDHMCAGYWDKPEETAVAIKGGWFYTGDLASIDDDGHLAIVGRKKDMLISGGINIYPAEIERVIEMHPNIAAAAVIGVPDDKWGEVGKAVVELKEGAVLSLTELQDFLKDRLGKFKVPKYLATVAEMPRTAASGKIQKFILKEKFAQAKNEWGTAVTISDNHSKILENLLNSGTQFFEFMQTLADAGQKNQESAHEELSARLFENYQRFYQEFIGKFLEAPQLGIYRETLHQFSAAIDAQHHFSVEVVQFLVKLGRPLEKSLKAVGKTLSSTPGGEFEFKTAQALHGHITAVLEQAYDDYLKSPVGVRDVADIIHRYVAYQEKLDDALDIWRKSLSIPMKKEMAEVYKGLYDLKKRVRQQNNLIDQQQKTIDRLIERIASLENKSDIKTGKKKTPT